MGLTPQELGKRLQEAREAMSLSQEQAATAIEVTRERIAGLETGDETINSLDIHRLSKLYKRTLRSILVVE